ncbi:MAG: RnfH family protein [Pseudomonadota bacterium]|nr:RnfH family protein [Pseudomonadota bacterium]
MTGHDAEIEVTVVFALPECATEIAVTLPAGATLLDALEGSGLEARHPDLDLSRAQTGIFGKLAGRGTPLAHGDRVEVYRPLVTDPEAQRRSRASARSKPIVK